MHIALIRDATGATQKGNLSILLVYTELKDTLVLSSTRSKGLAKTIESRIAGSNVPQIDPSCLTYAEAIQTIWTNESYDFTFIQQGAME